MALLKSLNLVDIRSARWLGLLALVWLALTAGLRPLMLPDEGRYVGVAWEMLQAGDWSVPLLDGMPFFHKPPLFYWLTAASMALFGPTEWAGRLASVLGAWLAVVGLYLFLRRYRDSRVATIAAVILASQPFFFAGAQFANLDMLVAGLISITILAGADAVLRAEQGLPYRAMLALAYSLAALGMLAKGLIGAVLPAGTLLVWLLLGRRWRSMATLIWLPGIALFLTLALPWFWLMQQRYPGFFDYFVIYHHFQRFSQTGFNNAHPFWFYLPVILLLTLPWSAWLWPATRQDYRRGGDPLGLSGLLWAWLLVVVGFFSLPASKLVGYVLPALPALAGLLALPLATWLQRDDAARVRRYYLATAALAGVVCVGAIVLVARHTGESAEPLARRLAQSFQPNDQLVMLDQYQYDLPFYLRLKQPAWVVGDWAAADILRHDNWRKELFDAGQFDRAAMRAQLLAPLEFERRLCAMPATATVWVWGSAESAQKFKLFGGLPLFLQGEARRVDQRVWRLAPPDPARRAQCAKRD